MYNHKREKYKELLQRLNDHGVRNRRFDAIIFESSGYTHAIARKRISSWEAEAHKRLGPEQHGDTPALWQGRSSCRTSISTAIHYWNAVSIVDRVGDHLAVVHKRM